MTNASSDAEGGLQSDHRLDRIEQTLERSTQLLERVIGVQDLLLTTQSQLVTVQNQLPTAQNQFLTAQDQQNRQIQILLDSATRHDAMIERLDTIIEMMIDWEGRGDNND